jgi:non-specific serine/threonine protein kinase
LLRGRPILSEDGSIPTWAQRSTPIAGPRPRGSIVDRPTSPRVTATRGLPGPADLVGKLLPRGPVPQDPKERLVAYAPLAMAAMVAVVLLAFVVALIIAVIV